MPMSTHNFRKRSDTIRERLKSINASHHAHEAGRSKFLLELKASPGPIVSDFENLRGL